ncbi:MarR family winged helix-turn-helix transcriptional regulator [Actinomadura rupiterrae]|uniref:MarR family winged helix-turn-helix transcriptional regulator n=1 Tax=Actinomadura rupiterrae TaxID=559627 RepID=UPI0020A2A22E|nr:MarR family winged helix-turn-helix transcriptional regulator [Actinomadura rupiterrae]MCP2340514.1 DNA-binding MarR family transcriptional regulator [Actinomadura rupiterrae]
MAEPDERLFFLLQRAAHQLRLAADRRLQAAAGISTAQLGALFAVQDAPGLTQRDLARTLGLRESAVTGLVTRLTSADLVVREPHPDEHRAVVLRLSAGGEAALRAAQPAIDAFNAELRAVLGDASFVQTSAALSRLVSAPEAQGSN